MFFSRKPAFPIFDERLNYSCFSGENRPVLRPAQHRRGDRGVAAAGVVDQANVGRVPRPFDQRVDAPDRARVSLLLEQVAHPHTGGFRATENHPVHLPEKNLDNIIDDRPGHINHKA